MEGTKNANGIVGLRPVAYHVARYQGLLRTGDVLLCRAGSLEGLLIARVTHAQYTHAGLAGWAAADALMLAETRQHADARLISLSSEVAAWPGYYDVWRPKVFFRHLEHGGYAADAAWSFMCHAAGSRYGWNYIWRTWARRRIGPWVPPIANSDDPFAPRDCSALVHAALRAGGGPQVKEHDCDVAPGDLADPRWFDYVCTLCGSDAQAASFADQIHARTLQRRVWGPVDGEANSEHVELDVATLPFPRPQAVPIFASDTWTEEGR